MITWLTTKRSRYVVALSWTYAALNTHSQELYRSCMSLRPKIVKLIDKYSQKRGLFAAMLQSNPVPEYSSPADLVSMNETFVKARTIFDRMMEDSLARHTGGMLTSILLCIKKVY